MKLAATRISLCAVLAFLAMRSSSGTAAPRGIQPFVDNHCLECHDSEGKKGGLDLSSLPFELTVETNFAKWVMVYDRVANGEMPPKKKPRPAPTELDKFTNFLSSSLLGAEQKRLKAEGRATQRRLNRYEYENALRDLLQAPWLQIRDSLPEDGERFRFNKIGDALDVSHVQMARYLTAADYALRQAMAPSADRPETRTTRYYARDQSSYTGPMKFSEFNTAPERATFPTMGTKGQPEVRREVAPMTVGPTNQVLRELEGVGVVASAYEPIEPTFDRFRAPVAGHYRLRLNALSVWVGPGESNHWYIPNLDDISPGRRAEPVTIYSEAPPHLLRWLGKFDVTPEAATHELDVWLLAGETIRPDAARLFRSRPGPSRWQNPLAEKDGQPGVVFRWLEVEGPIYEAWPPKGHQLLFADLPMVNKAVPAPDGQSMTNRSGRHRFRPLPGVEVVSQKPLQDAKRLLRNFIRHAYRRPVDNQEALRFVPIVQRALETGNNFTDAMLAAYTAMLCSPEFICLEERPGRLDDYALAARLSFFLWNSPPDDELRGLAARSQLHRPEVLRAQTERLLDSPKSRQFIDAFLDYWLDLRKMLANAPDAELYPEYYLDDLLTESALEETQLFFAELVRGDLPARNLIASDFAMLNERLATHYGLAPVEGVALRRVALPETTARGGLLTQASVLKVTANGTTTSPVIRGAWVMERILGKPIPPPPANVQAIDPDIRGAVTVRQQLEKHRTQASCAVCHSKMDPPGFALENFDVLGGWRERYRAVGDGVPEKGLAKSGQKFVFHLALPVDASGELPDGRQFHDIREFKQLLLGDEKQIARNLVRQLTIYATGSPVRFSDRAAIERILERASPSHFGVRSLLREVVQSPIFLYK